MDQMIKNVEKEYESIFTGMEFFGIDVPDKSTGKEIILKLRRVMTESKEGFKEMANFLGKEVEVLIQVESDANYQKEGTGKFWLEPKMLKKHSYCIMTIHMSFDKVAWKNWIDLYDHDCIVSINSIQPDLIVDYTEEEEE